MNFAKSVAASFLLIGTLVAAPAAVSAQGLGIAPPAAAETPADASTDAVAGGPPPLPAAVTPPPLPALPAYYVGIDGQPVGPLDEAALKEKVAEGVLTETSLVWTEGMADWDEAADVAEIAALLEPEIDKTPLGTKADENRAAAKVAEPPAATGAATSPAPGATLDTAALTGSWQIDGMMPIDDIGVGDAEMVQIYNPDGSYSASGTITAAVPGYGPAPVEMIVEVVGTWKLTTLPDGTTEITLKGTTYVEVPALGIPRQAAPGVDSFVVALVDADTIVDEDGVRWTRI